MINVIIVILIVALVVYMTRGARATSGSAPKANLSSFTKYAKFRKGRGKKVTSDDVDNVEQFSIAMGIDFTARQEAEALKNQLPRTARNLRQKAVNAYKLWTNLSKYAKTLSVVAGIVIFGLLYDIWLGPLWDMIVVSGLFLWALVLSAPYTVAGIAVFLIAAYIFRKTAPAREAKHKNAARAIEAKIPEVDEMYNLLNQ